MGDYVTLDDGLSTVTLYAETTWTGFAMPPNQSAAVLVGIGDGSEDNEALQTGAFPRRQLNVAGILEPDEKTIVEAWYETKVPVTVTEPNGTSRPAVVWEFTSGLGGPRFYNYSGVLKSLGPATVPGS